MADEKPEWQQVNEMFECFGAPPPPYRLRDEIVVRFAALKDLIAAEDGPEDQIREAFENARHALKP